MNKDAVSDADGGLSGYPGRGWGWTDDHPLSGQELKEEAPAGPLGGASPEDALGLWQGWGEQTGVDWGHSRVPGTLRQSSSCLLTQKGCRHGANLPHGGEAWSGTEEAP